MEWTETDSCGTPYLRFKDEGELLSRTTEKRFGHTDTVGLWTAPGDEIQGSRFKVQLCCH